MGIFDFLRRPNPPPASTPGSQAPAPPPGEVTAEAVLAQVEALRRTPVIAQVGGFPPPDDRRASWFGRAVGLPGEGLPEWEGRTLFPLLQINVGELPAVPPELAGTALLVVFLDIEEIPFDEPHGQGWCIREYSSLDGLEPLPDYPEPNRPRPFAVRWFVGEPEGPDWEDAWDLVDLAAVNDDPGVSEEFHERFANSERTKVGGYPHCIQHGAGLEGYVFQVGSEEKAHWNLVDNGVAHFFKSPGGQWRWECQFY
jgi:hypothetical protein